MGERRLLSIVNADQLRRVHKDRPYTLPVNGDGLLRQSGESGIASDSVFDETLQEALA